MHVFYPLTFTHTLSHLLLHTFTCSPFNTLSHFTLSFLPLQPFHSHFNTKTLSHSFKTNHTISHTLSCPLTFSHTFSLTFSTLSHTLALVLKLTLSHSLALISHSLSHSFLLICSYSDTNIFHSLTHTLTSFNILSPSHTHFCTFSLSPTNVSIYLTPNTLLTHSHPQAPTERTHQW